MNSKKKCAVLMEDLEELAWRRAVMLKLVAACQELERGVERAARLPQWSFEVAQALIPARNKAWEALAEVERQP